MGEILFDLIHMGPGFPLPLLHRVIKWRILAWIAGSHNAFPAACLAMRISINRLGRPGYCPTASLATGALSSIMTRHKWAGHVTHRRRIAWER